MNSIAYGAPTVRVTKDMWRHKDMYSFRKAEPSCKHTITQLHKKQTKETIDQEEMNPHFG